MCQTGRCSLEEYAPLRVARARAGLAASVTLAGVLMLLTLGAARAAASVKLGPDVIEVQGQEVSATVTRNPFRISFAGADGSPVLSEVENTSSSSLPLSRSVLAPASGPSGSTVYSPLTFLVGSDQAETFTTVKYAGKTSGQYAGDLMSVAETGTEYSAREVLTASATGEGVTLTLSTNDPSGRQLIVSIAPLSTPEGGEMRVAARPSDSSGVAAMSDSFSSATGEAFHGFGGRHDALDQHGREFFNWIDQENVTTAPEELANTALYPDGPLGAYYIQSSFVSNDGYGFLFNTNALSRWSLDAAHPEAWQAQAATPAIEYLVAPGAIAKAASKLTATTGRQRTPPAWALGPMFDREVEEPVERPAGYELKVADDLRQIARTKLPVSAYRIEGWAFLSDASLTGIIARLRELAIHPLLYFRTFVGQENIGTEDPAEFESAVKDGYVATGEEGKPYTFTDNFGSSAAVIDFTNPAAVTWWKGRIDAALELGADGFMLDFGEQVQPGMHFSDGSSGSDMHNRYPVLAQRVTREIVDQFEASHPGREIIFFTRSGNSGEPGSAAYESFNFPGDETTDWGSGSGLASLTPDMLNRAIGGAYGYGTDIGGYLDYYDAVDGSAFPRLSPTSRELFVRWAEWAALSPVFRLHGAIFREHTPWSFPETVKIYRLLSKLHVSAEGLIEELWKEADANGTPVTRPLYLEYPDDPQAALQTQEWLLGPNVLVAPVIEPNATTRTVYFPTGCWHDPETGETQDGPTSAIVAAGDEQLPFFFRCGTRPFRPPLHFNRHHERAGGRPQS